MTRLARTEREALCDLALELGPDAPTLSGEWTVKDLVVHLLVREGSPAAVGIVVAPLARLTESASARLARNDLPVLVERLRQGPPLYSPFRIGAVDRMANTLEYFVHHEDIRRAQAEWEPRDLDQRVQDALWKAIRVAGKGLVRSASVGVTLERTDTSERAALKEAPTAVVVRGLPAELVMFVYGRQDQARVELDGAPSDVAALTGADLGI
ncbi:MAG TPA: TIGR03085 family metal-binding protein [Nocardioidaceae bacterium]|nr:TIGR03085 family metal-binding protein [Nocardioidaceae bacterium]